MPDDFRRDRLDDIDVGLRQIDAGLPGLSADAGRDDNDIGASRVLIGAFVHFCGREEGRRLFDVHRFAARLFPIDIDKDDLRNRTCHHQRTADGQRLQNRHDNRYFVVHTCLFSVC